MSKLLLKGIATRSASRAPMTTRQSAQISEALGVEGDLRGKLKPGSSGKRQISVLSEESWKDTNAELGTNLSWTTRRANLLVSGIRFSESDVGKILRIGDVELLITRETDPCFRMDEAHQGLKEALTPDWRGGVCTKVIQGGTLSEGDTISLVESAE